MQTGNLTCWSCRDSISSRSRAARELSTATAPISSDPIFLWTIIRSQRRYRPSLAARGTTFARWRLILTNHSQHCSPNLSLDRWIAANRGREPRRKMQHFPPALEWNGLARSRVTAARNPPGNSYAALLHALAYSPAYLGARGLSRGNVAASVVLGFLSSTHRVPFWIDSMYRVWAPLDRY